MSAIFLGLLFVAATHFSLCLGNQYSTLELSSGNYSAYSSPSHGGIRVSAVPPQSSSSTQSRVSEYPKHCSPSPSPHEALFSNYPMYSKKDYLNHIRTLPGYDQSIIALHARIQNDKKFREQTANMPGFEYSFFLGWETSGFHKFVQAEQKRAEDACKIAREQAAAQAKQLEVAKEQERQRVLAQCLETLNKKYTEIAQTRGLPDGDERITLRIKAIEQTRAQSGKCFDYASQVPKLSPNDQYADVFKNTYGTHLDAHLHKDLCQTRSAMRELESGYAQINHVQIVADVVHRFAAQAKQEKDIAKAFQLSDFCYELTRVLGKGVYALTKGSAKAVIKFASPEHFKEMVTGALHLGAMFVDLAGQAIVSRGKILTAMACGDRKPLEEYCQHSVEQIDFVCSSMEKNHQKIAAMPWDRKLEASAELGTLMILDVLAFNALGGFAKTGGRTVVNQLNVAMERGLLGTQQYAVEVAGFGKLIIEEGVEAAGSAAEAIKNSSAVLNQEGKAVAQIMREVEGFCASSIHGLIKKSGDIQTNIKNIQAWASSKGWVQKYTDGGVEMWGTIKENGIFSWRVKIKREASMRPELGDGSKMPRFDVRIDEGIYYNPFIGQSGGKSIGTHIPLEF